MKAFFDAISSSFKWIIGAVITIVTMTAATIGYFDQRVEASENRVMQRVQEMRQADMEIIKSIKADTHLIKRALIKAPNGNR
jgi:TRAP-type uncharacterized transport system fused permease subunit